MVRRVIGVAAECSLTKNAAELPHFFCNYAAFFPHLIDDEPHHRPPANAANISESCCMHHRLDWGVCNDRQSDIDGGKGKVLQLVELDWNLFEGGMMNYRTVL